MTDEIQPGADRAMGLNVGADPGGTLRRAARPPARFHFGERSLKELIGVHPSLVECCHFAIRDSGVVDFAVHDGLRTLEEQRGYVASGVSQTLNSKHLPQADGYGHAVDLVPYINGKLRWEWGPIYEIARRMHGSSMGLECELVWGGVWDRPLCQLDRDNLDGEVRAYVARRQRQGLRAFTDGPHFQLFDT